MGSDDEIDNLVGTPPSFEQIVWQKHKNICGNCGGQHKLRVKMIVPEEAGGQKIESNGVLICRACELALDSAARLSDSAAQRRPVNFWVSRRLYDRMMTMIDRKDETTGERVRGDHRSMGALVRYLMMTYVKDPNRFDDLGSYQDSASGDVKINVWIPTDHYETFKKCVNDRGNTVTDAVKSLVQLYDETTSRK